MRRELPRRLPRDEGAELVKVSLLASLVLPVIFWQVWSFLAPAFEEISFASLVLFACAIVLELPLFIVALVRILQSQTLRRNRRAGYVAVAALGVALPGVDPVTTAIEIGPLIVLFELAIWAPALVDRRLVAAEAG